MNRSILPKIARWIITGRSKSFSPSLAGARYWSLNRSGKLKSSYGRERLDGRLVVDGRRDLPGWWRTGILA
jgi:hypothetical protein